MNRPTTHQQLRGFTLIELMIAMVLGLLIVGGVISVMLSNRQSYRTNQGLAQVQESARTAYELLAHDVRQSDSNGCGNVARTANVLVANALWWHDWFGVRGIDGGQVDAAVSVGAAVGERVAGTSSIHVQSIDSGLPVKLHDAAAWRFDLNAASANFAAGDLMLVCDFDHTTIFQASSYDPATVSVFHDMGVGTPGNCSHGLGLPSDCGTATGNAYVFSPNAQIGRLAITDWYIGNNGRAGEGGRSLYRRRMGLNGAMTTEEVVAGVTDMQVSYHVNGTDTLVDAATVAANWDSVTSMLITLTTQSADTNVTTDVAVNNGRIQRPFTYLITLRNRLT